jgi:transaldolase
VASFFVSRVDANIDAQLEKLSADNPEQAEAFEALLGQIAVANAQLAYAQFEEVFSGERWGRLAADGAQVQRPLWASTSTKNPDYPDLLYVETLIGPHTVNTMPPNTLESLLDHGQVARTIDQDYDAAQAAMAQLAAIGISIDDVTDALEEEGVRKFADSFVELLEAIEEQRQQLAAAQ